MKNAALLVAILLCLPFLDCFCKDTKPTGLNCDHCESAAHTQLPNDSHDCLDAINLFSSLDFSFHFLSPDRYRKSLISVKKDSFKFSIPLDKGSWFGKLKPHLALNIIQV